MKSNKKYQAIIFSGRDLFWKHGFRRVSIEEICKESNTSKMTFYKFFPNKIELAKKILDNIIDQSITKLHDIRDNDMSTAEKMAEIMKLKYEGSTDISEEFIKELYINPESELAQYMGQKTQEMFGELRVFYQAGKDNGWIRKDLNIDFLMSFVMNSVNSISSGEFSQFFNSSQEMLMEITRLFVYGMTPISKK
ncbi:MAG: TetR/AcrR family transcriptional regulator [Bacteroidales bacterium]|nr:TetR/AcrR family transcriptional regulator [Bacteroidales bacterium]